MTTAQERDGKDKAITTVESAGIYRMSDGTHYVAMAAQQPNSWWLLECVSTQNEESMGFNDWDIGHRQDNEGNTIVLGLAIHRIELITFQTVFLVQHIALLYKDGVVHPQPLRTESPQVLERFAAELVDRVQDPYPPGFAPP